MELRLLISNSKTGGFSVIKRVFKIKQGNRSSQIDVIWEEDPPLQALKMEEGP